MTYSVLACDGQIHCSVQYYTLSTRDQTGPLDPVPAWNTVQPVLLLPNQVPTQLSNISPRKGCQVREVNIPESGIFKEDD